MVPYKKEWDNQTTASWVKAHTEEEGRPVDCHEQANKRADGDAEQAYARPEDPGYMREYCSQFGTIL